METPRQPRTALPALEIATTRPASTLLRGLRALLTELRERYGLQRFRRALWSRIHARQILEVGVGAGANMLYYPEASNVTGVDLNPQKLEQAMLCAVVLESPVDLQLMDAERLAFADHGFDAAVATCVFCSVADPVRGMRELGRVVKPGGDIWLMEHMRIDKPVIGALMDLVNPVVVRLTGVNINRRTVENVKLAGLEIEQVENLMGTALRLIHAHPATAMPEQSREPAVAALAN